MLWFWAFGLRLFDYLISFLNLQNCILNTIALFEYFQPHC